MINIVLSMQQLNKIYVLLMLDVIPVFLKINIVEKQFQILSNVFQLLKEQWLNGVVVRTMKFVFMVYVIIEEFHVDLKKIHLQCFVDMMKSVFLQLVLRLVFLLVNLISNVLVLYQDLHVSMWDNHWLFQNWLVLKY